MNGIALDVARLPDYGFGHRSLLWWATLGLVVIEGTMFGLLIVTYVYLKGRVPHWPPAVPPPALTLGTANLVILLVSAIPNQLAKKAAEAFELRKVQLWLVVCIAFGVSFNVVRFF